MTLAVSRRTLLRMSGVLALSTAGCAAKQAGGGSPATLRMMWWGGDARTKAYQDALAAYGRGHPSIAVQTEPSKYDGYFAKLDADIAGGQPADLIQMDTALVGEYAGRGVLHPLDEYLGNRLDLSGFPDALLATGKVDGKLYGVPSGTGGALVTYDATVLRGANLAPPPADWTWAGLTTYASKVTAAFGGQVYGVSDGGGDDEGGFEIFLRQRRKELFTAEGALGYTEQDLQDWFAYWDGMRKSKAAAPGEVTSEAHNDASKNPLITGKVAMAFGVGLEISLPPLTSHDLDFVPVPNGPTGSAEGQYLSGGVLLSAFARSKLADDAAELIGFFATDDDAITIMGLTRGIPPTEKARQIAAAKLGPPQQRALAATNVIATRVAAAKTSPPPSPPKGAGQVKELLFQNNLAVAFGRKSVTAAVESFFAGARSALS